MRNFLSNKGLFKASRTVECIEPISKIKTNKKSKVNNPTSREITFFKKPKSKYIDLNSAHFTIHPRVFDQLKDTRLGQLAGKISSERLIDFINNKKGKVYFDTKSKHINHVQMLDGVMLRITSSKDEFIIISVGPIRSKNISNGIASGRFIPLEINQPNTTVMRHS